MFILGLKQVGRGFLLILTEMLVSVLPQVKKRLGQYHDILREVSGPLAQQGINSLRDKEFHCLGGSVYSLLAQRPYRRPVMDFIVAFQTVSDYLDNLCDRFGLKEEKVFRQLHLSMLDCLIPQGESYGDYYRHFPYNDDAGYLAMLVGQCRTALATLPYYSKNADYIREFTKLYIDLQSYKHMEITAGEASLASRYREVAGKIPDLYWWEYAAACGSTLGIFALVAGAARPQEIWNAYMPWLNGLHIMLDYFIDQDEDKEHGDMNLVSYYPGDKQVERISHFYRQSKEQVSSLPRARFHSLVTDGLLALYLTDQKAFSPQRKRGRARILALAGVRVRILSQLAGRLRRHGVI